MTTLKYAWFAVISTLLNIFAQYITLLFIDGRYSLVVAMANGSIVGLIAKYLLDKMFIFSYKTQNLMEDMSKFILYSSTGIGTTLIFWGTELLFHFIIPQEWSKYLGAVIGLSLGYTIKYHLDKSVVFR